MQLHYWNSVHSVLFLSRSPANISRFFALLRFSTAAQKRRRQRRLRRRHCLREVKRVTAVNSASKCARREAAGCAGCESGAESTSPIPTTSQLQSRANWSMESLSHGRLHAAFQQRTRENADATRADLLSHIWYAEAYTATRMCLMTASCAALKGKSMSGREVPGSMKT
jgi:hypothetical protein